MDNGAGFYRLLWKGGESRDPLRKSQWEIRDSWLGMKICVGWDIRMCHLVLVEEPRHRKERGSLKDLSLESL